MRRRGYLTLLGTVLVAGCSDGPDAAVIEADLLENTELDYSEGREITVRVTVVEGPVDAGALASALKLDTDRRLYESDTIGNTGEYLKEGASMELTFTTQEPVSDLSLVTTSDNIKFQ